MHDSMLTDGLDPLLRDSLRQETMSYPKLVRELESDSSAVVVRGSCA